jgi:branched-chain amino acid transport system substrate-binding protein
MKKLVESVSISRRSAILVGVMLILAISIFAACGDDDTPSPAATATPDVMTTATPDVTATATSDVTATATPDVMEKEEYVIGVAQALTGPGESFGTTFLKGIEMATDEINAAGGIDGHSIKLIIEDSKCAGSDAISAVTKLIEVDGVNVILGPTCSGAHLASASLIDPAEVVQITITGHPDLRYAGDFVFRNGYSAVFEAGGPAAAKAIIADGYTKAASITQDEDLAEFFRVSHEEGFKALGGEIVASERVRSDETDLRPQITKILAAEPEVIFGNLNSENLCGFLMSQARELGFDGPIHGFDVCIGTVAQELAGDAGENVFGIVPPFLTSDLYPKGSEFVSRFKERYGFITLEFAAAGSYDQVYLIKECVEEVGSIEDTPGIRDCLYNTDYVGALGQYNFDSDGEMVGLTPVVVKALPLDEREGSEFLYEPYGK